MPRGCAGERRRKENLALKRIILVLVMTAMMVAMTLGVAGTAMAQAPSAAELMAQMSEPLEGGCTLWFGSLTTCV